jgi:hypothetical protein
VLSCLSVWLCVSLAVHITGGVWCGVEERPLWGVAEFGGEGDAGEECEGLNEGGGGAEGDRQRRRGKRV